MNREGVKLMDCTYHGGTAAAGYCEVCGKPFCRACLVEVPDGRNYCRGCAYSAGSGPEPGASGMAVASLVLSIVSIFACPVTAIPGMIMGFVEMGRIKRGDAPKAGNGFALAGAIIGSVVTALMVLVVIFFIVMGIIVGFAGD